MKVISVSSFFTFVCFILVSFQIETVKAQTESRAECRVRATQRYTTQAQNDCNRRTPRPSGEALQSCINTALDQYVNDECSDINSNSGDCRSLRNAYDTAVNKTIEACSYLNVGSVQQCQQKAAACASGSTNVTNTFQNENSIGNLMVSVMQMRMAASGNQAADASSCLSLEDDEKAAREKDRIDEKISRLRREITEDKEKAGKADNDLNKKRREVEEKMAKLEEEANKAKVQRQTRTQEQANNLQKKILDAEKKRRQNSNTIAEKQIQIADLSFGHQEINLQFDPSRVQTACDERINKLKTEKMTTTDKNGNKTTRTLTNAQAAQMKKYLQEEQSNCIKEKALEQQAKVKGLVNAKRKLEMEIDELNASNADEAKAIESETKNLQALQGIADGEEAKELEIKLSKLNSLNLSVTDMEQYVVSQKETIDERIKNRENEINELTLQKNNVRARYSRVSSTVEGSAIAARNFVGQCCASPLSSSRRTTTSSRSSSSNSNYATAQVPGMEASCSRITTDYDVRSNSGGSMNRGSTGTGR
ncbi:hypothetical protein [Pseudobdellovibrio exovorus]|uniref:Uncharacterized protein n=1 Tax=Pseudobdellovibrio exovorus JSS TaxID=1184267 RepID=M4V7K4_9BACT|nr:hypothetical protein [Pseudobdellovibrio exovorus]AGH94415.1 hypothetical protein A11Q_195 [Pseudobdellovibrio exovorus JSS]